MATRSRGRPTQSDVIADATLLEAALQAFGENSYDGTSVREISRRLGVSHNLIPQRYGSKEKLWYAAIDFGFGRQQEDLLAKAEMLGEDALLVLRGLIASFIEINAYHPSLLQILNHEASRPGPRFEYLFVTYIEPVRDLGEGWLTHLAEEGRVSPISVSLLYFLMAHGAGGMFAMPALNSRLTSEAARLNPMTVREQAEQAANVLFDGLISRQG
jgi:TetR/AcrR family transcriptional regulator